MQDRFKFRFWHKPTNKMLDCYGFNEHCTFANTLDGIGTEYNPCATKDCELMQCTGLKDKNGKLIYEGDYIKNLKTNTIYKVFWEDKATCFMLKSTRFGGVVSTYMMFEEYPNDLEVIGNIYENPELLEVSNEY